MCHYFNCPVYCTPCLLHVCSVGLSNGNSSYWLILWTIYIYYYILLVSPSASHIVTVHQYPDAPWMCTDYIPQYPRWNCRGTFKPAISLLRAHSAWVVYNFWEGESEKERAQRGSARPLVCLSVCVCRQIKDCTKGQLQSDADKLIFGLLKCGIVILALSGVLLSWWRCC